MTKICKQCGIEKDLSLFRDFFDKKRGKYYRRSECIGCEKQYKQLPKYKEGRKQYNIENAEIISAQKKIYRSIPSNREAALSRTKTFDKDHKNDPIHIENRKKADSKYKKNKYASDIGYALKSSMFSNISGYLKSGFMYKDVSSHLSYTMQELKEHLEKQFEPWMNWDNRGKYNPKMWNDNDPATWTWQIDHIIPHSMFSYTSSQDEDFKKCWALCNLRPLSAKQNIVDGNRRNKEEV